MLAPRKAPKFEPLILTESPTCPVSGFNLLISGPVLSPALEATTVRDTVLAPVTVKEIPLLSCPPDLTTIRPLETPAGTATRISVLLHEAGTAHTPSKLTPLHPWETSIDGPKFSPMISTVVPSRPKVVFTASITGAGRSTTNANPWLACPPAVTVTRPLGAPAGTGTWISVSLQ